MVYRGQPSKDCLPCRKRKLRRPSCGQCKRAGIACSGYRDPNDFIFRDQTRMVHQKVSAANSRALLPVSADNDTLLLPDLTLGSIRTLQLDWVVRARHDFFAHYVFGMSGSYDMLATLYEEARMGDHLATSVDAASLAFMATSRHPGTPELLRQATKYYTIALRRLNEALSCQKTVAADSTLQSVLLLDLFEKMVSRNLAATASWMGHVYGGTMIAKVRGHRNLQTYVSQRLSTRLYITLVISCGVAGTRIPEGLGELKRGLDALFHDRHDLKWRVTSLNEDVVNFRADVLEGRYSDNVDLVAEAKRLDGLFCAVEASLPPDWDPKRVATNNDDDIENCLVFGCYYDIYAHHAVTQVRNVIRTMRIHLHILIQKHPASEDDIESSKAIVEACVLDICAGVPQFILPRARPENSTPFSPTQVLECFTILVPLYFAGHVSADPAVRPWTIGVLRYMAEVGGIEAARRTADTLEFSPEVEYWEMYSMLGGYAFAV
ncbi:hypothetical protein PT974_11458 [Cladobotryum mycophilum]|uniref:Zn(2)-C6 fungal-type domain-containing protein n=1 Tax=Cladobotryum mycophilum TaxID=491253 RepID=A0ABR0S656_9HYPO